MADRKRQTLPVRREWQARPAPVVLLAMLLVAGAACAQEHDTIPVTEAGPSDDAPAVFGERQNLGLIASDAITEASGLVASRRNPGVLWVHNDSGDGPRLFAIGTYGELLGTYYLAGAQARDWEDIALGPGPEAGVDYLYVGEIGDNLRQYPEALLYRVPEPAIAADQAAVVDTLGGTVALRFQYPDGPENAEALLSDPLTGDLYVVTKTTDRAVVYRMPPPHTPEMPLTLEQVARLDLTGFEPQDSPNQMIVAGDIAPSGRELLLKTYGYVYHWTRSSAAVSFFEKDPQRVPYVLEPQGEAIAWAADGQGYFTVSEEPHGFPAHLFFYPRIESGPGR